jgi:hypothetical protein
MTTQHPVVFDDATINNITPHLTHCIYPKIHKLLVVPSILALHPTTLLKDCCRRAPVVAIVIIDNTTDNTPKLLFL